jgi:hypothetical protein
MGDGLSRLFGISNDSKCDTDSDCDSDEECNSSDECGDISCNDGYQLDSKTNKCVLSPCPTGHQRNTGSNDCVLSPCATGYQRKTGSNDCVSEESFWHKPTGWYDDTNNKVDSEWKTKSFGSKYNMKCPDKSYVDTVYHNTGSHMDNMGFKCSDGSEHYMRSLKFDPWSTDDFSSGITTVPDYRMYNDGPGVRTIFKPVEDDPRFTDTPFSCPSGTKLTGMRGDYNDYIGNVEFRCS